MRVHLCMCVYESLSHCACTCVCAVCVCVCVCVCINACVCFSSREWGGWSVWVRVVTHVCVCRHVCVQKFWLAWHECVCVYDGVCVCVCVFVWGSVCVFSSCEYMVCFIDVWNISYDCGAICSKVESYTASVCVCVCVCMYLLLHTSVFGWHSSVCVCVWVCVSSDTVRLLGWNQQVVFFCACGTSWSLKSSNISSILSNISSLWNVL